MKQNRSLNANRYYRGVVLKMIADLTEDNQQDLHNQFKKEYCGGRSTSELNTKEFHEYISKIRAWARKELALRIPEPNEPPIFDEH